MHRLIREKWKPSGGWGDHFTGGPVFKDRRTKSGPPTISEKGQSHGTEGNALPVGRGWALVPGGQAAGVLLAVLLPPSTGPHQALPARYHTGGERDPTRPSWVGPPAAAGAKEPLCLARWSGSTL